ncbi:bifunctional hydroxymethylpyrimidine kinase/phosphomethylpyrimidine kinase [Leeuwenhoekiella sp. MAR_2009_132]|uniref:bifunctional hydroxymethylpyrimidine kinase/phosphomethylpyrimidine kinase n=1 Tax=Leeuwenhoekiella sp. MAR_2009_132 TaxID=1392489 RepID=UPI000490943F|nr:bifunctional hydroxymethylpyrimidine kinase/phosphomethylpyrimidine kinase [Leeuwenhoekiella sp. MAR_2009_132]
MKNYTYPSVMSIAGFDGSGGAGLQADLKTISALGCYATTVLTALPVQNTTGVKSIFSIPVSVVDEQLASIFDDILPSAVKIGMVHTPQLVETIARYLNQHPSIPIVFDPVMVATSGHKLIEEATIKSLVTHLFPIASIITPNMDEAALLAKMDVKNLDDMYVAGQKILQLGCKSVLLKGGHLNESTLTSLYFKEDGSVLEYSFERYETRNMHGSGCTLSSAIASYIAQGKTLERAVQLGQDYVHKAIYHAKDVVIGNGNGPLNHFFDPQKLIKNEME